MRSKQTDHGIWQVQHAGADLSAGGKQMILSGSRQTLCRGAHVMFGLAAAFLLFAAVPAFAQCNFTGTWQDKL